MRYVTFSLPGDSSQHIGIVEKDQILDLSECANFMGIQIPSTLLELICKGKSFSDMLARTIQEAIAGKNSNFKSYPLSAVRLQAPIPRPQKNIVCLGLNYKSHMEETARARGREIKIPEVPVFFTKAPTAVNGPQDDIPWDPNVTQQVDYEAELAVVIGAGGKNIPRSKALDHVFGYTVLNDMTGRDVQQKHLQWFKGKSLDGFCPMGPYLVTADEFGDPQNKRISLRVNSETKQDANTAAMIFPVAVIIEALSKGMTLESGDIISTGTPEGVGLGRTPPEYLREGDIVETEVEGIGKLRNRIVISRSS
ncbi:MAG: 5-carboxymethyl-2-hydroxymuconate isomerase [Acidobacteria bacterium RIFCSPLOWO2_12_FULL_54_10]|nr:MAG: 5-carboxymethyl-2-hydroxymuconate isomerase [Acidobacteria bacterium RIFCSPLOWO2_12_FULL_54_10]